MKIKIDLVVTRHEPLVALLRERNLIDEKTPVCAHASVSDVKGKHVVGVLPHHLSQHCASITEVQMSLTPEDRAAMQRGELSLERTREVAGELRTYQVFGGPRRHRDIKDAAFATDLQDALRRLADMVFVGGAAARPLSDVSPGSRVIVRLAGHVVAVAVVRSRDDEDAPGWVRENPQVPVRWITEPAYRDEIDPEWGVLPGSLLALPMD